MAADGPTVDEIVDHAVATEEKYDEVLNHYEYQQTIVSQNLEKDDKIKETIQLDLVVHPGVENGFTISSGTRDGVPMSASDLAKVEKKAKESEMFKSNFSLRKLASRFNRVLMGQEIVNGQQAYIIGFSPKGDQPDLEPMERILGDLQGQIWISTADYAILKTQAHLAKPMDLAWFFATIRKLEFYYESQPVDDIHGPSKFDLTYQVSLLVGEIHNRQMLTMKNIKKIN